MRDSLPAPPLRPRLVVCALVAVACALPGCDKTGAADLAGQPSTRLDSPNPALPAPDSLPTLAPMPVVWSVSRRARMLHSDGLKALDAGELKGALGKLTEAVQLDPSLTEARLALARLYQAAGRGEVALTLLLSLAADLEGCGGCVEALHHAVQEPAFAPLWQDPRGASVRAKVKDLRLPWDEWALRVSTSLSSGQGKLLPEFVHPFEPFTLVRSCPTCSNPERRAPVGRELFGPHVAVKLASRFNTSEKRLQGTALVVPETRERVGRCMRWTLPKPVPVGKAALRELCFRPVTRDRAALTRIDVVYGRTQADVDRTAPQRPKAESPR